MILAVTAKGPEPIIVRLWNGTYHQNRRSTRAKGGDTVFTGPANITDSVAHAAGKLVDARPLPKLPTVRNPCFPSQDES